MSHIISGEQGYREGERVGTHEPSVSLALPPVGWHSTVEQLTQRTTV